MHYKAMRLILVLSFFVLANSGKAQKSIPYHALCTQACAQIEKGNIEQASHFLFEAFQKGILPRAADYLNYAKCFSQQAQPDSTEKYLYLALKRDPLIGRTVRIHSLWFKPILGDESWNKIVALTHAEPQLPESIQMVVNKLSSIDSLVIVADRNFYFRFNSTPPIDSAKASLAWDSVVQFAQLKQTQLESILLSLPDSILTHYAVEKRYKMMTLNYRFIDLNKNTSIYWQLIDKGFLTPDLLLSNFLEEEYGAEYKNKGFNFNQLSISFCDKYGLSHHFKMNSLRNYNAWDYDDLEE